MQTKIWLQTGNAMEGKDPSTWDPFQKTLVKHVREVARADTKVDVHGTPHGSPWGIDRYQASKHLLTEMFIKNAIRAEQEGYDAWVCVNTLDPGFYEIREVVDIPTIFIVETSLYLACLLAPRFALITHNESMLLRLTELAKQYGLAERMVPGAHLGLTYAQLYPMFNNPKACIEALTNEGRKVIQRGANMIALLAGNPLNVFALNQGIKDIDGVPILDAAGAVVKVAEMMVDLKRMGISRSKEGLYAAPAKDGLATLRKLYGF